MAEEIKNNNRLKWLLIMTIFFSIILILIITACLLFKKKYENKIYPGLYLGELNLGGQTANGAKNAINQKINKINQDGIAVYYNYQSSNKKGIIYPIISSMEGDLAYEIISFNVNQTVEAAMRFGRDNNFFVNWQNKIKALIFNKPIGLSAALNDEKIIENLKNNFSQYETPPTDAQLVFQKNISNLAGYFTFDSLNFIITNEKAGKTIDYEQSISQLKNNLIRLDFSPLELHDQIKLPSIYKKDCLNIEYKVKQTLSSAPIALTQNIATSSDSNNKTWEISKEQIAGWLNLKINQQAPSGEKIFIGLYPDKVKNFLQEKVALEINIEPINAKFAIKNGRVSEFQASQNGKKLDIEKNFSKIEYEFITENKNEIKLIIDEIKSTVSTQEVNGLGIKEIIGIGESNFSGSPKNRRHNIKIGADTINGTLIVPGEEFSLIKTLGEIEASTGYLPELVIKDNKTTPEYGGGLCQVGTTMFRAALASGLPITMRQNHSYRVSYYEPAGTDATIYNPWPDFKFINDTNNYILIQSRIEGDNLYFDFWGAKDNRIIDRTDPVIYNITKPGPTKIIETLDLKVGEKKCTEHAHNGADTYFDYKVVYNDGRVGEKRFNSHYVPWREVCLIGVEKLSADNNTSATSTEKLKNN